MADGNEAAAGDVRPAKQARIQKQLKGNYRGLLAVLGGFLIQLTAGTYHGTFGNLLPYFSSYVKKDYPDITHGDLAMVFSSGGLAQGVSCMLGGLIFVPILGKRGCLMFSCFIFTLGIFLTYLALDSSLTAISFTYGIILASAANLITLCTMLIPVTWFPEHRGKVLGVVTSGYGLSSTVFSPIQTFLINPSNAAPQQKGNTSSSYFKPEDIENFPSSFLYLGCTYAVLFLLGILLTVEKPIEEEKDDDGPTLLERLRNSFSYLFYHTFTRLDFYLLWLTRFLFLTVGSGMLAHWKTLAFTQSADDKMMSIAGGVNGIMNCLSRGIAGALLDRVKFNQFMPAISAVLTVLLLSIFFIAQESLIGLIVCIWIIYALNFSHFSTVPAQTITLFNNANTSVVIGTIGLADSFSFLALGILNKFIISQEEDEKMFLWFFVTLASCSFLGIFVSYFVSSEGPGEEEEIEVGINIKP